MHCSDEQLLAQFDGELSFFANRRVRRHLEICWRCRTRLAALEVEIHRLLVQTDEWRFPSPEWNLDARKRLVSRLEQCESQVAAPIRTGIARKWVLASSSAAVLLIAGIAISYFRHEPMPSRPQPSDLIAHAASIETVKYVRPVHQTFSLRIAEIRPSGKTVDTQLQVWADNQAGKFAYRLSGPGGALKHALWRPGANEEFVYKPDVSKSIIRRPQHRTERVSLASLADNGLDPAQIESAFMGWMEDRPWAPIAFSADLSLWVADDGTVARADRIQSSTGVSVIRLTVQRHLRKAVALLTVDLDSNSFLPRVQTIRFEAGQRIVEFRLEALKIETLKSSDILPAMFQPDPGLQPGPITGSALMLRLPVESRSSSPRLEDALPSWNIDELRARYALHQAGACLGESVRISEEAGAVSVLRRGGVGAYSSEASLEAVLSALTELREASPREGNSALRHAWALRQFAREVHSRKLSGLTSEFLNVIDSIVRDHISGLRNGLSELGLARPNAGEHKPLLGDWNISVSALFDVVSQLANRSQNDYSAEATQALISTAYDQIDALSLSIAAEIDHNRKASAGQR